MRRNCLVPLLALVLALGLAGCSRDDAPDVTHSAAPSETVLPVETARPSESAAPSESGLPEETYHAGTDGRVDGGQDREDGSLGEDIKDAVDDAGDAVKDAADDAKDTAKDAVDGAKDAAKDAARGAGKAMEKIGGDLTEHR